MLTNEDLWLVSHATDSVTGRIYIVDISSPVDISLPDGMSATSDLSALHVTYTIKEQDLHSPLT